MAAPQPSRPGVCNKEEKNQNYRYPQIFHVFSNPVLTLALPLHCDAQRRPALPCRAFTPHCPASLRDAFALPRDGSRDIAFAMPRTTPPSTAFALRRCAKPLPRRTPPCKTSHWSTVHCLCFARLSVRCLALPLLRCAKPRSATKRPAFALPRLAARCSATQSLCIALQNRASPLRLQLFFFERALTSFHSNRPIPEFRHCPSPRNRP